MKRLISLVFFSLVFAMMLAAFAAAQSTTCGVNGGDDLIMRLSGTTNAHGELWDVGTSTYTTEICYSDIFGRAYTGSNAGSTVHDCTSIDPGNLVLRLKTNTNSHGETPDNTNPAYTFNVCYGDLDCRSITSGSCNANEEGVVRLYSNTNAHLETTAGTGGYGIKICCSSTPPSITGAIWSYYDYRQIPNNNPPVPNELICPNSYVIMRATDVRGIASGSQISFELWDQDTPLTGGVDDQIPLNPPITGAVSGNQVNATLNLSNSALIGELENALSETLEGNELELYFKARYTGATDAVSYEIGYDGGSSCTYSRPIANVRAPVHQGVYFKDVPVTFVSGCTSPIGPLRTEWTITPQTGSVVTKTEERFLHTFTSAGQVNVKLKCTDLRGQYAINESQVLVADPSRKDTLAFIDDPAMNSFEYNLPPSKQGAPYFPEEVSFKAEDSFVVDVAPGASGSCPSITCLGGECPTTTENNPNGCTTSTNNIAITPQTGGISYINLFFNWTFWDSNWNEPWASFEGNDVESGAVQYDDMSNSLNDKHMSVLVNYTGPGTSASASFQRDFTLGRCLNNGNRYYTSASEWNSTNEANDRCKGGDSIAGTGDDCCPAGLQCLPSTSQSSSQHSCQIPSRIITRCSDFTEQGPCNSNNNPAVPRASYGRNPPACTFLQCYWIGSDGGSCGVRATQYSGGANGCIAGPNSCVLNDCAWTTTQTECVNGWRTIRYTGTSSLPNPSNQCTGTTSLCDRDPVDVPCGSLSFELNFFGKAQFIISVIAITILYIAFNFYRGKKHGKKK